MKTYLKDIGSVSLLTGEQEVELAMRIQDLVYLEGVREQLEEEAKRRKVVEVKKVGGAKRSGWSQRINHGNGRRESSRRNWRRSCPRGQGSAAREGWELRCIFKRSYETGLFCFDDQRRYVISDREGDPLHETTEG